MSKQGALFNPGKILEALENGLTFLSIQLETAVEKKLKRFYKKDRIAIRVKKREAERQKQNKERASQQGFILKNHVKQHNKNSALKIKKRLESLENIIQDHSHDAKLDRG